MLSANMGENEQKAFERRQLLTTRYEQIEKEKNDIIIARKNSVRENHLRQQRGNGLENGYRRTPFHPFSFIPENGWNVVFDRLSDPADLLNCMYSCEDFANMLRGKRTKFLFGQVLPFLVDKLSFEDFLNIRGVCQKWCSEADNFIDSVNHPTRAELLGQSTPYVRSQTVTRFVQSCPYMFTIPLKDPLEIANPESRRNAMKSHPRSPFIGKRLCLKVNISTPDERDSTEVLGEAILSDFGGNLFHLEIVIESLSFHARQFFKLICHAFEICKNLKTLKIVILSDEFGYLTYNEADFSSDEIPSCLSLESITVIENKRTQAIQVDLIRKLSNQLKNLKVFRLNENLYSRLVWQSLRCLDVEEGDVIIWSVDHVTMEAPQLEELDLGFYNIETVEFKKLMRFINQFPVLTTGTFRFRGESRGPYRDEILKTEHIPEVVCSHTITCLNLQLTVRQKCIMSFDFLLFFPFLERLFIETTILNQGPPRSTLISAEPYDDFIDLAQRIFEEISNEDDNDTKPLSYSNIWQVLTRLQLMKFVLNMNYRQADTEQDVENYLVTNSKISLSRVLSMI